LEYSFTDRRNTLGSICKKVAANIDGRIEQIESSAYTNIAVTLSQKYVKVLDLLTARKGLLLCLKSHFEQEIDIQHMHSKFENKEVGIGLISNVFVRNYACNILEIFKHSFGTNNFLESSEAQMVVYEEEMHMTTNIVNVLGRSNDVCNILFDDTSSAQETSLWDTHILPTFHPSRFVYHVEYMKSAKKRVRKCFNDMNQGLHNCMVALGKMQDTSIGTHNRKPIDAKGICKLKIEILATMHHIFSDCVKYCIESLEESAYRINCVLYISTMVLGHKPGECCCYLQMIADPEDQGHVPLTLKIAEDILTN
jgi:hypothetical protein